MDYTGYYILSLVLFVVLFAYVFRATKVIPPYAQGVVTLFGAYRGILNPGYNMVTPYATVTIVDLRSQCRGMAPAMFATASGTPVNLGGSVDYRVTDAAKSVFQTRDVPGTLAAQFRDSLALAVSTTAWEGIIGAGWQIAGNTRSALAKDATKYGVSVDRVRVMLATQEGPIEFFDGAPVDPVPTSPRALPRSAR